MRTSSSLATRILVCFVLVLYFQLVLSQWVNRYGYLFDAAHFDISFGESEERNVDTPDLIFRQSKFYKAHYIVKSYRQQQHFGPGLVAKYGAFQRMADGSVVDVSDKIDGGAFGLEFKDPIMILLLNPATYGLKAETKRFVPKSLRIGLGGIVDLIAGAGTTEVDLTIRSVSTQDESPYQPFLRPIVGRITHITYNEVPVFISKLPDTSKVDQLSSWRFETNLDMACALVRKALHRNSQGIQLLHLLLSQRRLIVQWCESQEHVQHWSMKREREEISMASASHRQRQL